MSHYRPSDQGSPWRSRELTRDFIAGLVIAINVAVGVETTAKPPNVLLILADDLGYSDLGCYGGEIETPQLDALAAGGVKFTQFYNTARCWPTRAALMTGYYAQQVQRDVLPGVKGRGQGNRPSWAPLVASTLRAAGYGTYHSGKWHIDGVPTSEGFIHSYEVDDHNRFFYPQNHKRDGQKLPPIEPGSGYYNTTAIADHALECLTEHQAQRSAQPFFSYVAFLSPHFPLHALPEDIATYDGVYDQGWDVARQDRMQRIESLLGLPAKLSPLEPAIGPPYSFPDDIEKLGAGEVIRELDWSSLTAQQQSFQAAKMQIHAAMVDRMDQEIGRIVDFLRQSSQLNDTLILFLSDNGASAEIMIRGDGHDSSASPGSGDTFLCLGPGWSSCANTPFRRHKTWVHEGGISTPLVAHWPNGIQHTGVRHQVGHVIDIVPTLLELAGIENPVTKSGPPSPGRSLLSAMKSDEPMLRQPLWWLHDGHRAYRDGDWKIVSAKGDPWELFNLAEDRSETENLANSYSERVESMSHDWQAMTDAMVKLRSTGN